ncbi:hypothetical protein UPYG_G00267790 [Umbra pygmaea]|uniref:B30.2/SPRY domain-containing protein n=1 Tax=Umbra pygmaea TaxID=75934 RepID=A0ABD0WA96_UMBPY
MAEKSKRTWRCLDGSMLYLLLLMWVVSTASLDEDDFEIKDEDDEEDLAHEYSMTEDKHTCLSGQTGQYPFCKDQVVHHNIYTRDECGEVEFQEIMVKLQLMIQDRKEKMKQIVNSVEVTTKNLEREKDGALMILTEIARLVEKTYVEVIEDIDKKREETATWAVKHILELKEDISMLQERSTKMEKISHTKEHLKDLQMFPSLCSIPETKDWSGVSSHSDPGVGVMMIAVCKLREALNSEENRLSSVELGRIKKCAVDVTLDPATAHPNLIVSEDRKQVRAVYLRQNVTDSPQRFDTSFDILANEGFSSGRFYYEVQVDGNNIWDLGLAIESINRKGPVTLSTQHGYLAICLRDDNKLYATSDPVVSLTLSQKPQKIGVYVDYERGQVSFYDVDIRSHIYTFTDYIFNKIMYPYFGPSSPRFGKNTAPFVITPVRQELSINFPFVDNS